jgi:hypothetical protein
MNNHVSRLRYCSTAGGRAPGILWTGDRIRSILSVDVVVKNIPTILPRTEFRKFSLQPTTSYLVYNG